MILQGLGKFGNALFSDREIAILILIILLLIQYTSRLSVIYNYLKIFIHIMFWSITAYQVSPMEVLLSFLRIQRRQADVLLASLIEEVHLSYIWLWNSTIWIVASVSRVFLFSLSLLDRLDALFVERLCHLNTIEASRGWSWLINIAASRCKLLGTWSVGVIANVSSSSSWNALRAINASGCGFIDK